MTRLTRMDIQPLEGSLARYDQYLLEATGHDLTGLALTAVGLPSEDTTRRALAKLRLAVVPITSGLGLIGGFARSVGAILDHLGCQTYVSQTTDVAGLADAARQKPAAIFLSDDNDFMALDGVYGTAIHNTSATALGFVAGLACMAGGLKEKKVLVLGCGPVGNTATEYLLQYDAQVVLFDVEANRCTTLRDRLKGQAYKQIKVATSHQEAVAGIDLIFDATNTADHIDTDVITRHTRIAAPGMPCGVTAAARRQLGKHLLHDPLQLGVATMAAQVLAARRKNESAHEGGHHG